MNYLAHVYLSGENREIVIGNFIGDYIKGHNFGYYCKGIQKGILLHRNIDLFTDTHTIVKESKSYFYKKYHRYAGIVVDIIYDHFLSRNWNKYCPVKLEDYVRDLHSILLKHFDLLPKDVQNFVPSFIEKDWINSYDSSDGLHLVFTKMSKRTSLPDEADFAIKMLEINYEEIDNQFNRFFPEIIQFVKKNFEITFS